MEQLVKIRFDSLLMDSTGFWKRIIRTERLAYKKDKILLCVSSLATDNTLTLHHGLRYDTFPFYICYYVIHLIALCRCKAHSFVHLRASCGDPCMLMKLTTRKHNIVLWTLNSVSIKSCFSTWRSQRTSSELTFILPFIPHSNPSTERLIILLRDARPHSNTEIHHSQRCRTPIHYWGLLGSLPV